MMQQIYPTPPHSYTYELHKDFHFAAAHYVPSTEAGVCKYTHGHTYFVDVAVAGNELNQQGFLVNFKIIKDLIHKRFDHTVLNDDEIFSDTDPNGFPTSEVVARKVYEMIQDYLNTCENKPVCLQVFLRETPTSYCVYRPRKAGEC